MKSQKRYLLALGFGLLSGVYPAFADNPLILDQFTADPTARVFEGKIYLYPSHDFLPPSGNGRGFAMEDYHAFSSENLMDWTDHGVIVAQTQVPWVNPTNRMWAPDCVTKNGKYYFYFPAPPKVAAGVRDAWGIGVAIADKPGGPFKPEETPIAGAKGIDPCVLIDKDGQAYLFYSLNAIFVAKLKDNMVDLATQPEIIPNLPAKGLVEGPFAFERKGKYYLTFPHAATNRERLEYAMADSPQGPYKMVGVIMDESASGCWTNHHSIVEYKDQWYLFYHDKDLSPNNDAKRSVHADYLSFNDDGTIQKVIPTLRGVGIADAKNKIQIDRFSAVSEKGTSVAFLDDANKNLGWKITLQEKAAWVQYDRVDFGNGGLKAVDVRSTSTTGCVLDFRLDKPEGPAVAELEVGNDSHWNVTHLKLNHALSGVHNLIVSMKGNNEVAVDWVRFAPE